MSTLNQMNTTNLNTEKMSKQQTTLDILIDALSDNDWAQLKLKAESRKAFQKIEVFEAKRRSAIEFGDWILKHNIVNGYDEDGSSCWVVPDGKGNTYTSLELYNIYLIGEWNQEDEELDS